VYTEPISNVATYLNINNFKQVDQGFNLTDFWTPLTFSVWTKSAETCPAEERDGLRVSKR